MSNHANIRDRLNKLADGFAQAADLGESGRAAQKHLARPSFSTRRSFAQSAQEAARLCPIKPVLPRPDRRDESQLNDNRASDIKMLLALAEGEYEKYCSTSFERKTKSPA